MLSVKLFKPLPLWLLLCHGGLAFGQAADTLTAAKWSLEQCIAYAKKNNIQINSLRLNQQVAGRQVLLGRSQLLPDLFGSVSQSVNRSQGAGGTSSGKYNLNSSWTLYRGGYLRQDLQQRQLAVESANLSVQEEENNLTLEITSAYLNILLDKESLVYYQDLVETSAAQLRQARNRYAAGSIARRDVVQFEAQLANDLYLQTTARNARRLDLLNLRTLLQLPLMPAFDIVEPDTVLAEQPIPALEQVSEFALKNRPEIKNSDLNLRIAQLEVKKARAGFKPTVNASGSIGSSTSANSRLPGPFNQLSDNFYQQAALSLSLPLFANRLNRTNEELALLGEKQAILDLANSRTLLAQKVEQAYINALNAQSQFAAAAEQFRYNRELIRIANEELRIGAANIFNFYQQRNLYIQALQNFLQAKYNAALSASIYTFYAGVPIKI